MIKVAVTAAGGGVGQSIIKSLRDTEYHTVAIDPDMRAAGLYMAEESIIGPRLDSESFVADLIDVCKHTKCNYLFSGFDAELPLIAAHLEDFLANGILPVVSSSKVINLSNSKLALVNYMAAAGFPIIGTATNVEEASALDLYAPYIVKPDAGCRSQGVYKFNTLKEVQTYIKKAEDSSLLIQEYVDGEEYTCGSVSMDGGVYGVIAMRRELRAGDTYKAVVDQNPVVIKFVNDLMAKIRPFGPCNVQLRLDKNNIPRVLEINARCSGTTAARTLAGFNEPLMVLDLLVHGRFTKPRIKDVEILRYWNEIVVTPESRSKVQT